MVDLSMANSGQMPAGGESPAGASPAGAPAQPPHLAALDQIHSANKAQFEKIDSSKQTLERVRVQLDQLAKLGDNVTTEDVIKAGGGLVAAGLTPKAVAGLMATLPQGGGEALAGWVQQHEQMLEQQEQQNQQMHQMAAHQMGVSAIHALASHAHEAQGAQKAQAPQAPKSMPPAAAAAATAPAASNPLMPTADAGGSALGV